MRLTRRRHSRSLKGENLIATFGDYQLHELGHAIRTIQSYAGDLRVLQRFCSKPVEEIDADDLRDFKRRSTLAPSTKSRMITAFRQFHHWGALEGFWPLGQVASVRPSKIQRNLKPGLTQEQAAQFVYSCRTPAEYRVIFLGLFAGLRVSEAASITRREWWDDRLVLFGKGGKQRTVPIHPRLAQARERILSNSITRNGLMTSFRRLVDRLDVTDAAGGRPGTHSLRRTFADSLYQRCEAPREVVRQILGHGIETTDLYAPVRFDQMKRAVHRLTYDGPIQSPLEALADLDAAGLSLARFVRVPTETERTARHAI